MKQPQENNSYIVEIDDYELEGTVSTSFQADSIFDAHKQAEEWAKSKGYHMTNTFGGYPWRRIVTERKYISWRKFVYPWQSVMSPQFEMRLHQPILVDPEHEKDILAAKGKMERLLGKDRINYDANSEASGSKEPSSVCEGSLDDEEVSR